ncbi:hypothetical protein SPSYN_00202 [Sporotomaculum syntrophicum]|uniref:Uncharacterized protein n=1 Tax=Sporotomaculum syntrophicum TaxID=182264 RepID=A0A9D2WSD5_9FIRM|nr:hypothetical protein [Sporotomaculum syntrophicum]KAF1086483.1 hypothetical protein SPSYN_00202 [Sporotomaculum syntrophicum]
MAEFNPDTEISVKVRLDFKGQGRPGRFLFGGKPVDRAAEEVREQQVALLRNVPIQGIHIDDIDTSIEVYTVWDDENEVNVAYAPVIITVTADNIEDLLRFIVRESFCKIEVIEPASIVMSRYDLERFLFKVSKEMKNYVARLERKHNL